MNERRTLADAIECAMRVGPIGMPRDEFERRHMSPMDLVGLSADEQMAILGGIRPQGTQREPITPEQHALNEAALNAITAEIGRAQGIEPWVPGRVVGAEYPGDDAGDKEFIAELKTLHDAHQPYMDWMLDEQRKAAERDRAIAEQKAKIEAEAAERYQNDPSRPRGPVMTVQREPDAILDAASERCFLEEI